MKKLSLFFVLTLVLFSLALLAASSVDLQGFGGGNDAAASTFLNNNNTSNPAAFVFSGDTVGTGSCTNTP